MLYSIPWLAGGYNLQNNSTSYCDAEVLVASTVVAAAAADAAAADAVCLLAAAAAVFQSPFR